MLAGRTCFGGKLVRLTSQQAARLLAIRRRAYKQVPPGHQTGQDDVPSQPFTTVYVRVGTQVVSDERTKTNATHEIRISRSFLNITRLATSQQQGVGSRRRPRLKGGALEEP